MYVNVIIPTLDRFESMTETIRSLESQTYPKVSASIFVDGIPDTLKKIEGWTKKLPRIPIQIFFHEERKDWPYCINFVLANTNYDAYIYGSDDLSFHPDCISKAVTSMLFSFKNLDGIIGLNQLQDGRPKGRKNAFGLVGATFIGRFPNRQLFCPDYKHFADPELGELANLEKKFYFNERAKLDHRRPKDKTFELGMDVYKKDKETRKQRRSLGYLWGKNFKLIKEVVNNENIVIKS